MKKILIPFLCVCLILASCQQQETSDQNQQAWFNTTLSLEQRVDALVDEMTLAEKISQMYNEAPAIERLGVPAYNWWNEALHGVARAGKATVFPQAIGMAAMFDEQMMHDIATVISDEARAKHHYYFDNGVVAKYTGLTFWSPNINIFRDPRWGRGQETYGEDPFLTGELAVQFIKGLQGDDKKYLKTSAMAKHFAVHSGPEKSRHSDNYHSSPRDFYETYLPAFETAVKEANVESIMCAYNRVNDDPACGNDYLLKDVLRGKWGFKGHVVSDCGAISDFYDRSAHNVVRAPSAAAAWAVRSGTDLNCGTGHLSVFANLHFAVQRNFITEEEIDQAVKRLFTTRFKLGLFDPKEDVAFANIPMDVVGQESHLALTEEAARKSLVLLKNNGLLPLKKGQKVAVIGPNATNPDVLVGNYNGTPIKPVSVLDGIRSYLGEENVSYAAGSSLSGDIYGHYAVVGADNFFHTDEQGSEQRGLEASYYEAKLNPPNRYGRTSGEKVGEPVIQRVEEVIDFYWQRSPLDDSVFDEFAVEWEGLLKPVESGVYRFQTIGKVEINGEEIEESITLEAGKRYDLKVSRVFVRSEWGNPLEANIDLRWVNESRNRVADAVAAAEQADVIIFVGGISPRLEGEEMPVDLDGFDYGDRTHIKLPGAQQDVIEVLEALGKPMVMINFSGSAIALNWQDQNLDALVQAFYPGEATGKAVADLLWGEYSPAGKLPVTFYRSIDDLPGFKDYDVGNRTYKYYKGRSLYPFGHGLTYSKFSYTEPAAEKSDKGLSVTVEVSNQGGMDSDQVTQVYLSLVNAPSYVPQKELVAFTRHHLKAGESARLSFTIEDKQLGYIDEAGEHQAYQGPIKLVIGADQFINKIDLTSQL